MITISSYYGNSASAENNAKVVTVDGVSFYFSYETIVAVKDHESGDLKVIQNYWGPTTGKHLNEIDGGSKEAKAERLDNDAFDKLVEQIKTQVYVGA